MSARLRRSEGSERRPYLAAVLSLVEVRLVSEGEAHTAAGNGARTTSEVETRTSSGGETRAVSDDEDRTAAGGEARTVSADEARRASGGEARTGELAPGKPVGMWLSVIAGLCRMTMPGSLGNAR